MRAFNQVPRDLVRVFILIELLLLLLLLCINWLHGMRALLQRANREKNKCVRVLVFVTFRQVVGVLYTRSTRAQNHSQLWAFNSFVAGVLLLSLCVSG